jgi:hypothetical protein
MTKYCTTLSISNSYGTVDNKTELEPSDDAATANWGSEWQMPSRKQCDELYNSSYTTTTWTTLNGVYGYEITSNSNSIFLPAGGRCEGESLHNTGSDGYYWSRTLSTGNSSDANYLDFYFSGIDRSINYRYRGLSVRPVRVKN